MPESHSETKVAQYVALKATPEWYRNTAGERCFKHARPEYAESVAAWPANENEHAPWLNRREQEMILRTLEDGCGDPGMEWCISCRDWIADDANHRHQTAIALLRERLATP